MSVYQDRIQGTDRLLRIRRLKRVVYAALAFLAILLIYFRLASEGASLKPFFIPLDGPVEVGLVMGLLGTVLGFYFRHLEIQAATTDSQRHLMTKYSMGRAVTTAGLCTALALVLMLPGVAAGAGSLFTDPQRYIQVQASGTQAIDFTSPDPFGVSFVRYAQVSVVSGSVEVSLLRENLTVYKVTLAAGGSAPISVEPDGWAALASWSVSFHNLASSAAIVTLTLQMGVMPSLFAAVPFLLLLYAAGNLGWWVKIRPIRDRSKAGALYAGGATALDGGERAYAEYAADPVADVVPTTTRLEPPPPPPSAPPPPPAPVPSVTLAPAPAEPRAEAQPPAPRADTPETFTAKGDALAMALQYAPAVIAYNEALRLRSDYMPALLAKAGALMALNKDEEALDTYRRIQALDPGREPASRGIATLFAKHARWREALEAADAFLAKRPNDAAILELKGDVLSNLGRRPEALAAYEAANAIDPSNANVKQKIEEVRVDVPGLLSRALIASANGNYAQALSLFDDILEVEPSNVNALIGKAVAYRRSGKPQEALNCLDLVLNIQPNNAAAFLNRGSVLAEQGHLEDALGNFEKLVALTPEDWEGWTAQGDVLVKLGRPEEALRAFHEALRHDPGDEDIQRRIDELEAARATHPDVLQVLYTVKGVGPARAKALVDAGFKTAEDFQKATLDQLLAVKGITHRIAEDLLKQFRAALVEAH